MQIPKSSSLAVLILANIFILIQYYIFNWNSGDVLLLFWVESAIIGFFMILKLISTISRSERKDFTISGRSSKSSLEMYLGEKSFQIVNKIYILLFLIPFFIVHFGGFMAGHLLFIILLFIPDFSLNLVFAIIASSIPLFLSHGYSFFFNFLLNKEYDKLKVDNIMIMPYRRIVVMHLTIILGVAINAPILFLFGAKIIADAYSHISEHGGIIIKEK
jgi:hypothetical protein